MNASAWRALDAELRGDPSRQTWQRAAWPVRDGWWALLEAAPALPACEAWPRQAQLDALLDPLSHSPLEVAIVARPDAASEAEVAARSAGRLPVREAAPLLRPPTRAATSPALRGASPKPPVLPPLPPLPPLLPPATATPATQRSPQAAHEAGTKQAGARVAALWARHGRPDAAAVAAPAGSDAAARRASKVVSLPLRPSAIAPAWPGRLPAPVRRWHDAFESALSTQAAIEALIAFGAAAACGGAASGDPAHGTPALRSVGGAEREAAAAAAAMPWQAIDRRLQPRAAGDATTRRAQGGGRDDAVSDRADRAGAGGDGVAAALSRIEARLAAAPAAAAASVPMPATAPASPEWLDDDERLAERIHDILRRQARRHGIDTP